MTVKAAYDFYDCKGDTIEFEFDWRSVSSTDPEDANRTQINAAVREAIYQETEVKKPIRAVVILGGDVHDLINDL